MRALAALILTALPALPLAADEAPFDYWVLSLSWSPSWCEDQADSGSAGAAAQCAPGRGRGFVVHGLWPQYDEGWPEYCATDARDPRRAESGAMADLMGSSGLAWHSWRKHGRCSGLSGTAYYDTTRRAMDAVDIPPIFSQLNQPVNLPVAVIEDAFLEVNPVMVRDGITVTCKDGELAEVRLCLDHQLRPRACAPDAARDCRAGVMRMQPPR